MRIRSLSILALAFALAVTAWGDTLVLRNGTHMAGRFVSGQNTTITFAVEGGRNRQFNVNEIARVEFNQAGETADRFNSDNYGDDQHARYDGYRNRPDYRNAQAQTGAIDAKYQEMNRAGIPLGQPIGAEQVSSDGQGRSRAYQNSTVYWSPRTGAHEVHGAIREQYLRLGAENGRLGYPISDEVPAPDGVGRTSNFEHGSIYWSAKTGARVDYARYRNIQFGLKLYF
jgi:uncharacterized protein with LGFP repeats